MKRKAIRNKESERVCDVLYDKENDRIMLEHKVGKQTIRMEYNQFIQAVERATSDNLQG